MTRTPAQLTNLALNLPTEPLIGVTLAEAQQFGFDCRLPGAHLWGFPVIILDLPPQTERIA